MIAVTVISLTDRHHFTAEFPAVPRVGEVVVLRSDDDPDARMRREVYDVSYHETDAGIWEVSLMITPPNGGS